MPTDRAPAKKVLGLIALASTFAAVTADLCSVINSDFPSDLGCTCTHTTTSLKTVCSKTISASKDFAARTCEGIGSLRACTPAVPYYNFDTTISATFTINACTMPASLSMTIANSNPDVSKTWKRSATDTKMFPVPEAVWGVHGIADGTVRLRG
jgi:hypothetical protein